MIIFAHLLYCIVFGVSSSEEHVDVVSPSDPLVFNLQLLHDGHLPGGPGQHDPDENPAQGLRQIQPGGGPGRPGERVGRYWSSCLQSYQLYYFDFICSSQGHIRTGGWSKSM